jgi:hypothetical protein
MPESPVPAALAEPSPVAAGRHRAGRLAATMLGLTLLAAGAAACSSGGGSGDQKSGGDSTAAAAPTGIQVPGRIASLTKGGETPGVKAFEGLPKSVARNLHYVDYADPADNLGRYVSIQGGPGLPIPAEGSPDVISRLFSEWNVGAASTKVAKVSAGPVSGLAECGPHGTTGKDFECGWVSGKVALVMSFTGFKEDEVKALVPKILAAMVTS